MITVRNKTMAYSIGGTERTDVCTRVILLLLFRLLFVVIFTSRFLLGVSPRQLHFLRTLQRPLAPRYPACQTGALQRRRCCVAPQHGAPSFPWRARPHPSCHRPELYCTRRHRCRGCCGSAMDPSPLITPLAFVSLFARFLSTPTPLPAHSYSDLHFWIRPPELGDL